MILGFLLLLQPRPEDSNGSVEAFFRASCRFFLQVLWLLVRGLMGAIRMILLTSVPRSLFHDRELTSLEGRKRTDDGLVEDRFISVIRRACQSNVP